MKTIQVQDYINKDFWEDFKVSEFELGTEKDLYLLLPGTVYRIFGSEAGTIGEERTIKNKWDKGVKVRINNEYETLEQIIEALSKPKDTEGIWVAKNYSHADLVRDLNKLIEAEKFI